MIGVTWLSPRREAAWVRRRGATGLGFPVGVAVDGAGRIYVANFNSSSIAVYAAGANGNATPNVTISGSNTGSRANGWSGAAVLRRSSRFSDTRASSRRSGTRN